MSADERAAISPGPWEWEQDAANALLVRAADGRRVCEIIAETDELEEIDGRNVQALAALPLMLDGLLAAREWLQGWASAEPYLNRIEHAIEAAVGKKP